MTQFSGFSLLIHLFIFNWYSLYAKLSILGMELQENEEDKDERYIKRLIRKILKIINIF